MMMMMMMTGCWSSGAWLVSKAEETAPEEVDAGVKVAINCRPTFPKIFSQRWYLSWVVKAKGAICIPILCRNNLFPLFNRFPSYTNTCKSALLVQRPNMARLRNLRTSRSHFSPFSFSLVFLWDLFNAWSSNLTLLLSKRSQAFGCWSNNRRAMEKKQSSTLKLHLEILVKRVE